MSPWVQTCVSSALGPTAVFVGPLQARCIAVLSLGLFLIISLTFSPLIAHSSQIYLYSVGVSTPRPSAYTCPTTLHLIRSCRSCWSVSDSLWTCSASHPVRDANRLSVNTGHAVRWTQARQGVSGEAGMRREEPWELQARLFSAGWHSRRSSSRNVTAAEP